MGVLLCIDTATENASVSISNSDGVIAIQNNYTQKEHASFLQVAIQEILKEASLQLAEIDAIALTNGPGSYTGLRVGLASAKGLCYALNKPLILLNTLEVMAMAVKEQYSEPNQLYCPMIDARRMEVFTAVYNNNLEAVIEPQAMIIDHASFEDLLQNNRIVFSGSGKDKLKSILQHTNAIYSELMYDASNMIALADQKFKKNLFDTIAYSEPNYLKPFFTTMKV